MQSYVIRSWKVYEEPNRQGNFIEIRGRKPGITSWFLSLLGVEPTVSLFVSSDTYVHEAGSLSGRFVRSIPLSKISSTYYGYMKPWKELISFIIMGGVLSYSTSLAIDSSGFGKAFVIGLFLFVALGLVYYLLNKKLTLGVFEVGGNSLGFEIKRSVIEGKKLKEKDAEVVADIIQQLIDMKDKQFDAPDSYSARAS